MASKISDLLEAFGQFAPGIQDISTEFMMEIYSTSILKEKNNVDVNGSDVPMQPLHYPVVPPVVEQVPPMRSEWRRLDLCGVELERKIFRKHRSNLLGRSTVKLLDGRRGERAQVAGIRPTAGNPCDDLLTTIQAHPNERQNLFRNC